jgi:hypothetical protein
MAIYELGMDMFRAYLVEQAEESSEAVLQQLGMLQLCLSSTRLLHAYLYSVFWDAWLLLQ